MENDFLIKKINAKVEVECHGKGNAIKTQWVVTTGTDLFQHWIWMDTLPRGVRCEHSVYPKGTK